MHSGVESVFLKLCSILVVGLIWLSGGASDAQANEAWKSLRGHSVCGGIDQYGKLQPPCSPSPATYVGKAVTQCPKGSFEDLGTCWSCPSGYDRTVYKIDGTGPVDASLPPHLVVAPCWQSSPDEQSLQPSREGFIKMGGSGKCLTVIGKGDSQLIVPRVCGADKSNQIWRPLAQR